MSARFTCILVDDDADFLDLEKRYLTTSCPDLAVFTFQRAEEALAYVRGHPVNLVITDLRMPAMDGIAFTNAIRAFNVDLPVMIFSDTEIKTDALAAGANMFITKEVFARSHRAVIQELLSICRSGSNSPS